MMSADKSNGDNKTAPEMRAEQTRSHPQLAIDSEENEELVTVSEPVTHTGKRSVSLALSNSSSALTRIIAEGMKGKFTMYRVAYDPGSSQMTGSSKPIFTWATSGRVQVSRLMYGII